MDSRFTLKGTFSIYGKSFPMDMSLNWVSGYNGIDGRITEFFLTSHNQAYSDYLDEVEETDIANKTEATERKERAEFERLKAKYGNE